MAGSRSTCAVPVIERPLPFYRSIVMINLHKIASKQFLKYRKRRFTTKYNYTLERKHTVVTTELKEKDV